jgi:hypothetical protein
MKTLGCLIMLIFVFPLVGKDKTSVLKACFRYNGENFNISTEKEEEAEKAGFNKYRDSNRFMRKMKIFVNGTQTNFYKPIDDHCMTIYRIPTGKQEVSIELKSVAYTTLEIKQPYSTNFRTNRVHETFFEVIEGPVAKVKIIQQSNNVSVYQALDNKPVDNCEAECNVPVGIPVYFKLKSLDEKTKCPVQYELVVSSEKEKGLNCYSDSGIRLMLEKFVEKNNVECRVNLEYAFFRVFGEGCVVMMESDQEGLRPKSPEIKMIPLERQRYIYFWRINGAEKTPYIFTGDRKGQDKTPAEGDLIELIEERNL